LPGVKLILEALPVLRRPKSLSRTDVQKLAGVVPLVDGLVDVYTLVALKPDEGGIEEPTNYLAYLGLANSGFAFEEERTAKLHGQKDRRRQTLIRQVPGLPKPLLKFQRTRNAGGQRPPASVSGFTQRPKASSTARRVHTRAKCRRKSAEAALSEAGPAPSSTALAASAICSGLAPESACSTEEALMGVEPMAVNPMRAEPMLPSDFSTTAATPTMYQSSDRRLNFLYDQPTFEPSLGTRISVTTS